MLRRKWMFLAAFLLAGGCRGEMAEQPRYEPFEGSELFASGSSALPLPEGVVPREAIVGNEALRTGSVNGEFVNEFPIPLTDEVVARGQERFNIYCAPCHGAAGYGDGLLTLYEFPAPPSYHSDGLRDAPVGYFFNVITDGKGIMFSYADRVSVLDRWAIIAYIRALQLSQHAPVEDLAAHEREQLAE